MKGAFIAVAILAAVEAGPSSGSGSGGGVLTGKDFDSSTAGALWRSWKAGSTALAAASGAPTVAEGSGSGAAPGGPAPGCRLMWDPREGGWTYRCAAAQPQVPFLQPYSGVNTDNNERVDLNWYLGGYYKDKK